MIKKLLSIILFLIIIFVTLFLNKKLENLQNMGSGDENENEILIRGALPYLNMYEVLTQDPITNSTNQYALNLEDKLTTPPYSYTDFSSNLVEETTKKDFAYFNNSTSILAGRKHKPEYKF